MVLNGGSPRKLSDQTTIFTTSIGGTGCQKNIVVLDLNRCITTDHITCLIFGSLMLVGQLRGQR